MSRTQHPHPDCDTCNDYLDRRAHVIAAGVVFYAHLRRIGTDQLLAEYVRGVHKRHTAGLSLAVTP